MLADESAVGSARHADQRAALRVGLAGELSRDLWAKCGPGRAEGDKTGDTKKRSKREARRAR